LPTILTKTKFQFYGKIRFQQIFMPVANRTKKHFQTQLLDLGVSWFCRLVKLELTLGME